MDTSYISDLLPHLCSELDAAGVSYQVVDEPTGFGKDPRPVYVTTGVKPDGWSRYGTCKTCKRRLGLNAGGYCNESCGPCGEAGWLKLIMSPDYLWKTLERHSHSRLLGLSWLDDPEANTVLEVRERLAKGELRGVGAERGCVVSAAIEEWRNRVREILRN